MEKPTGATVISDLLSVIHSAIIHHYGENTIILDELKQIDEKINSKMLEDLNVTGEPLFMSIVSKEMQQSLSPRPADEYSDEEIKAFMDKYSWEVDNDDSDTYHLVWFEKFDSYFPTQHPNFTDRERLLAEYLNEIN